MVTDVETPPTDETPDTALALARRAPLPITLTDLAVLKGEAVEIIEARIRVLETARKAAIRATHPEDWVLYKAPDDAGGQITGYLQDSGCERVRDIFGISISNVSAPEKIAAADPGDFHYVVRGDGHCTLTAQAIEGIEGGRSSTEDFCRDKSGAALELAVRKAARANLDGQIVRELAGLGSVPIAELKAGWTGTHKTTDGCRLGRGFGSRSERLGANPTRGGAPDVEPPVCEVCGKRGVYRPERDGRAAFYGCPDYQKHPNKKWTVDAAGWVKSKRNAAEKSADAATPAAAATTTKAPAAPPLTADDVFGGGGGGRSREPGSEG